MKTKPAKPYKSFPLYAHASGQWAKKVRNKLYYFGVWDDPDSALSAWLKVKDELNAGRVPMVWDPDALTIAECLNSPTGSQEATTRCWRALRALLGRLFCSGQDGDELLRQESTCGNSPAA